MSRTDRTAPAAPSPRPHGAQPLLRVRGLQKAFDGTPVLRSVDLELRSGQVLALIGPSGSGKTTVLRCLNALERADGGVVDLDDVRVDLGADPTRAQLDALRDRSAMVFQHFHLFPHRTVLQNVTEGPLVVQRRPAAEVRAEALELLRRVGLDGRADAYPHEMSGGQQQRVAIVRALALRPQLLLFDEPTSALDPELVGDVLALMSELAREGWTMVVVTHELTFARDVADQVAFMDGGLVVEHGVPADVLGRPRQPRTQQFLRRLLRGTELPPDDPTDGVRTVAT
ncbi:amino acid ABC transporter ATP-binding protein [Cellulomonas marina]|uniref:Cystine transport system ATP-binding protein n=1 Tax=Cellulomonas marina TaxID=988821 RepID=A0A1I1AFR8_9CELL|nr:amino acid ABC transporter ATP-binding protein [Cellulomonas marina]GIG29686.1 L-cystine import ATP-binding protein TcyC [Cellulomonas marina]SFB36322.1 cystine transport system ATP-binding protein [Cellulomonas marina]